MVVHAFNSIAVEVEAVKFQVSQRNREILSQNIK